MDAAFCLPATAPTGLVTTPIWGVAVQTAGQLMGMLDSFKPMFEIVTPLGSDRQ